MDASEEQVCAKSEKELRRKIKRCIMEQFYSKHF
jgi:hypothetical protein